MTVILQTEVDKLKSKILNVCSQVEQNVEKAVTSVSKGDIKLAQDVIESDEQIDQKEIEVEEECLKILALHQPVAIDLRYVIAILKINNDLERIGDLAVNIAEQSIAIHEVKTFEIPIDFKDMVNKVQKMLTGSLDAMVNVDEEKAQEVLDSDDEVDKIHLKNYKLVSEKVMEQPGQATLMMRVTSVSRNLERIADYATNIAEDVMYMIRGKIIRHGHCE